ncbi:ADP-ribosylglycohydrolase family protein, partial [Streptomyces sp. SID6139]
ALAFGAYATADGDFREAVLTAVNMGRDADTTAAVAGALSGATQGLSAIPAAWADAIGPARGRCLPSMGGRHVLELADLLLQPTEPPGPAPAALDPTAPPQPTPAAPRPTAAPQPTPAAPRPTAPPQPTPAALQTTAPPLPALAAHRPTAVPASVPVPLPVLTVEAGTAVDGGMGAVGCAARVGTEGTV